MTLAPAEPDVRSLSTSELVAYIAARHHGVLRDALPFLVTLVAKVARVHGDHDPRLRELHAEFEELRETLDAHLDSEEEVLFREAAADAPDAALLRRELAEMRAEHHSLVGAFGRVRALCDSYVPPDWACTSYRSMLHELRTLEDELLRHVGIEEGVLLPRFL